MRQSLPYRRPNLTLDFDFSGQAFTLCVGFDLDGRPREVFCDGQRSGSQIQAFISDACILISIALQHDVTPEALGKSLGRVPAFHDGNEAEDHASPIGAIIERLTAEVSA